MQNPKNPAAYLTLARIYEQAYDYQKAAGVYERALESLPNFWGAASELAFLLCEYQRTDANLQRALKLASQAYRLQPGNPAVLDTLAWVHYHQGNYPPALQVFEELAKQLPENERINYHLAMALLRSGREKEARTKLELALKDKKTFPGRADAEKTLKTLKSNG